jgi:hypothetical protein
MLRKDLVGLTGGILLSLSVFGSSPAQENKDREKIIEFLKEKGAKTYIMIDKHSKLNYEFEIIRGDSMLYQIQSNDAYFLVVNNENKKRSLYFDFNADGNVEILVEQNNLPLNEIIEGIYDVLNMRDGKSTKNKNLRKIASSDDEANSLFKKDLSKICKLLSL